MKIFVEALAFTGYHGVYAEERRDGRRYVADLSVEVDDAITGGTDAIDHTVDYRDLARAVLDVGQDESHELIETVAGRILDLLFARHPDIAHAELTLRKYATGVPGSPGRVGVELHRTRD